MTLIYKECGRRWKAPEDAFTVGVDNKTGRVLLHNKLIKKNKNLEFSMVCFSFYLYKNLA